MDISVIIPCYNENPEVLRETVLKTDGSLSKLKDSKYEIIVVLDGSPLSYDHLELPNTRMIRHEYNQGYGASLMTGIVNAKHNLIGIADSDGTYPIERFHEFLPLMRNADMVVGKRPWSDISWVRRPAKMVLHYFASFMAGHDVMDLNTGMRVFKKDIVFKHRGLFPKRFSFTSTLTMISITSGHRVRAIEIDYAKRIGKSSIKPISDTIAFFSLVLRLSLYFNPLKIFVPMSLVFLALACGKGVKDYYLSQSVGNVALLLFFMGFQTFFFGLIAEVVNRRSA